MGKYLTTQEVAIRLGFTPQWVRKLCEAGRLKAEKLSRDWLIDPKSVEQYEHINRGTNGEKHNSNDG